MEKRKICIFETEVYIDSYTEISHHIPVGDFIEVTEEEYDKYRAYVIWYNNSSPKHRSTGTYYTMVTLPKKLNWSSFNKDTEQYRKDEATRKAKAAVSAKKRKETIARKKIEKAKQAVLDLKAEGIDVTKLEGME